MTATGDNSSVAGRDNVSFTVRVESTYSTGQSAEVKLYIDGREMDTARGVINANSEETFNLHWTAQQGEHSYTIKTYNIVGGEKFTEDEVMKRTKILISVFLFLLWLFSIPVAWENGSIGKIIHIILLIGILHYLTHEYKYKEPYIIGDSSKVEYLTEEELKERLEHGKDIES